MKRIFGLILCLLAALAMSATALAENYVVYYNNVDASIYEALLIDRDGNRLIPSGAYGELFTLTPDGTPAQDALYVASKSTLPAGLTEEEFYENYDQYAVSALLDGSGTPLTAFNYAYFALDDASDTIVFTTTDMRRGVMDRKGRVLLEPDYFGVAPNGEGGYLVIARNGDARPDYSAYYPILYIDAAGRRYDTGYHCTPGGLNGFSEGFCSVYDVLELDGDSDCFFMDAHGAPQFDTSFYYSDGFHYNCAAVGLGSGRYALIDRRGLSVGGELYRDISFTEFQDDAVFIAVADDHFAIYDARTGECRMTARYAGETSLYAWPLSYGLIEVSGDDQNDIYNYSGRLLFTYNTYDVMLNTWFNRMDDTQPPQRFVITEGSWPYTSSHLTDLQGRPCSDEWLELSPLIWKDGHGRFSTSTYKIVDYDDYASIDWNSVRYGVCDENGVELLPQRYSELTALDLDRYWVRLGSRVGLIDGEGNWLLTINDYAYLMD